MASQQAVLIACSTEAPVTAWDLATATQLSAYKGNACGRNRLARLGADAFVAAQLGKDALHFWAWHKDQVLQRCFTQEPLTALAASRDGAYIAGGGASGTLYAWEAASGRLLRAWPGHYKAVSCLAFSDGGGLLVSGGEDTLACAWLLAEVLDERRDLQAGGAAAAAAAGAGSARVEPLHTWSQHTLPVSCVCLGMGDAGALLATASLDRSIKLWSLGSGHLLRSIGLPAGVTALALDAGEQVLLAGCADGSIYEVSLIGAQHQQASTAASQQQQAGAQLPAGVVGGPGSCCYEGHAKAVSSLAVTADGEQLVSGSEDGSARVWDLRSRQCLRSIASPGRAPVSAALLVDWPSHLAGLGQAAAGAGGRAGPKRMQPLAPLAKFAASASGLKPWEGPPMILGGTCCSSSVAAGSGLLPAPLGPLEALQLAGQHGAAAEPGPALAAAAGDAMDAAGPGAGSCDDHPAGERGEAAQLQASVQALQAQLSEARAVAQQWQALHAELHQFSTESLLAATQ